MSIILSEINHVDIEVINISFGSKAVHLHVQPYYFTWYPLLCTLVFFFEIKGRSSAAQLSKG